MPEKMDHYMELSQELGSFTISDKIGLSSFHVSRLSTTVSLPRASMKETYAFISVVFPWEIYHFEGGVFV